MADSAILAAGGADAPLSYLVPGSAVITIKQIHVKYVDNGAGGDWLPAVRIVNDAGHTMGTAADQGVKVTAGSDADASFFPGVKHAAAVTPAATGTVYAYTKCPSETINTGNTNFTFTTMELSSESAPIFSIGATAGKQGLIISQVGHYIAYTTLICFGLGTTLDAHMGVKSALITKGEFLYGTADWTIHGKCSFIELWYVTPLDTGNVIVGSVTNTSGTNNTCLLYRTIIQLDTLDPSFDPF